MNRLNVKRKSSRRSLTCMTSCHYRTATLAANRPPQLTTHYNSLGHRAEQPATDRLNPDLETHSFSLPRLCGVMRCTSTGLQSCSGLKADMMVGCGWILTHADQRGSRAKLVFFFIPAARRRWHFLCFGVLL